MILPKGVYKSILLGDRPNRAYQAAIVSECLLA